MSRVECVVVGAGAVGLATARALSYAGVECLVLEKGQSFGSETSSRSSEVIHRGMYYPRESLKSRLCLAGRELLMSYLTERDIGLNVCGKLIVATSVEDDAKLKGILHNATNSRITDLRYLRSEEVRRLESRVSCHSGLLSPNTAVFDSHGFMLHLAGDIQDRGSDLLYDCEFLSAIATVDGFEVHTSQGGVSSRLLINAAGLHSCFVAGRIEPYPAEIVPRCYFAKGSYFRLRGRSPFQHLIYPLPSDGGLGIHCTIDLAGLAKFGPDVEWLKAPGASSADQFCFSAPVSASAYAVDDSRVSMFANEIRKYWPDLPEDLLEADYSGIRPKLAPPNGIVPDPNFQVARRNPGDFVIEGPSDHGIPGLLNLFGIESPGLTSSLAIGEMVKDLVIRR